MSLFGMFETRANLQNPAVPLTSYSLLDWMSGPRVDSGIYVSPQTALTFSSVYRCTALISSVCAALPLQGFAKGSLEKAPTLLLDNPHPDYTAFELWQLSYVHRCMWGNSYMQKIRADNGRVQWLWPLLPERVQVGRAKPIPENPSGKVFQVTDESGKTYAFTNREVLHIPNMGYDGLTGCSPVRMAAQGIGIALAAEKYAAKLFSSGNLLSGILQTEQRLKQEDAERIQARWRSMVGGMDRAHDVAVLDSGAKFQNLTMPPADAEMLLSRKWQVTDIARFWGVPSFLLLDTERATSWGTALEQQAIGWLKFDLHPQWLAPAEQRITKELTAGSVNVRYLSADLERGDSAARAQFYQIMRTIGVFNVDEVREREDLPPLPDGAGTDYRQPFNSMSQAPVTDDQTGGGGGGGGSGGSGDSGGSGGGGI